MIRQATVDDIPRLLAMGEKFADRAKLIDHVGYEPESMKQTFNDMIEGGHPIFVGEQGAIGATSAWHPFNRSHAIAQEVFWWSEGREGLRLLAALEEWCIPNVKSLRMITLEALNPERIGQLYIKRGYTSLEHSYIKVF